MKVQPIASIYKSTGTAKKQYNQELYAGGTPDYNPKEEDAVVTISTPSTEKDNLVLYTNKGTIKR